MSIRNRIGRLEAENPAPRECHCPKGDDAGPRSPGLVEVSRHVGPKLTAECRDCGGLYELQIIECVVERAPEGGR